MPRRDIGVFLTYEDISYGPSGVYVPSRKRNRLLQKPPKKKIVQQKEIHKEIEEVVFSIV